MIRESDSKNFLMISATYNYCRENTIREKRYVVTLYYPNQLLWRRPNTTYYHSGPVLKVINYREQKLRSSAESSSAEPDPYCRGQNLRNSDSQGKSLQSLTKHPVQ